MRKIVLTFDNLGEAAELQSGAWPVGRPMGRHVSVTDGLPALLRELRVLGLPATFCVEGQNCEQYPEAVLDIADAGHELALHGWRHERWDDLSVDEEHRVIERSLDAFAHLGIHPVGFRPPGGATNDGTLEHLAAHGLVWCSPEGTHARVDASSGIALLPFRWPLVDALYLFGPFATLRTAHGLPPAGTDPEEAAQLLYRELLGDPDPLASTLILHPFLAAQPGAGAAILELLRTLARARDAGTVCVVTAGELAAELRRRTLHVAADPAEAG